MWHNMYLNFLLSSMAIIATFVLCLMGLSHDMQPLKALSDHFTLKTPFGNLFQKNPLLVRS